MYLAGEAASSGSGMSSSRSRLALAAGFVVVTPGCRGRDNLALNGTYYGKAPAAIVDLKAVVRYIRHNRHIMPGNSERIISVGGSAGGALSALLGASGNSPLYDKYLEDIGAANETDHIYAGACFSPITDLEHSDMSYEWMFGDVPAQSVLVDQAHSQELRGEYSRYQRSLNLRGKDNFGILSADNYDEYLMSRYLIPSANRFLKGLPEEKLQIYLETNNWIKWDGEGARFSFREYVRRMGRIKGVPAFDDFSMSSAEPVLFGSETVNARHFTEFSLSHGENDLREGIDPDLKTIVNMMNAMDFIQKNDSECAKYWWLRNGAMDNHTSQTVMTNLAAGLENRGRNVDSWIYWNKGHCGDDDPEGFISWIGDISGFYK
jgi:hypothetical protein